MTRLKWNFERNHEYNFEYNLEHNHKHSDSIVISRSDQTIGTTWYNHIVNKYYIYV